jgi:hypothetical protein
MAGHGYSRSDRASAAVVIADGRQPAIAASRVTRRSPKATTDRYRLPFHQGAMTGPAARPAGSSRRALINVEPGDSDERVCASE